MLRLKKRLDKLSTSHIKFANLSAMSTTRVLKLGGSLLLLPDWPRRLTSWLELHPAPLNLLLVGGGQIVDAVRELDAQHDLPTAFAHWLCIDLLSATARIAGQLLPSFPLLTTPAELQQVMGDRRLNESPGREHEDGSRPTLRQSNSYIVVVSCFYHTPATLAAARANVGDVPPVDCPLPENWDTTSDSLAAWLASLVGAGELVLFKSTAPSSEHLTPQAWVDQAIVDASFADILPPKTSATIVNLLRFS